MPLPLPLLLALLTPAALANPCAYEVWAGRQAWTGTPQPDISLLREDLRVEVPVEYVGDRTSGYVEATAASFTVRYTFRNDGERREVRMGFPVGRVRRDAVQDVRVTDPTTGRAVPVTSDPLDLAGADLSFCEAGWFEAPPGAGGPPGSTPAPAVPPDRVADAVGRPPRGGLALHPHPMPSQIQWFTWPQVFEADAETRVDVSYTVRSEGDTASVSYILTTSRHWGDGTIGALDITVAFPGDLPRKVPFAPTATPVGARWDPRSRTLTWHLEGTRPVEDLEIRIRPGGS